MISSREIATLYDKYHHHVKRDIEVMCQQLGLDVLKHTYLDSQNRKQTEYLVDKETYLCLREGYNAKLRITQVVHLN